MTDFSNGVWNGDARERFTFFKRTMTNFSDGVRNGDVGERRTIRKGIIAYYFDVIHPFDTFNLYPKLTWTNVIDCTHRVWDFEDLDVVRTILTIFI